MDLMGLATGANLFVSIMQVLMEIHSNKCYFGRICGGGYTLNRQYN